MVAITGPYRTGEGDDRVLVGKRRGRDAIVQAQQGILERDQGRTIFGAYTQLGSGQDSNEARVVGSNEVKSVLSK